MFLSKDPDIPAPLEEPFSSLYNIYLDDFIFVIHMARHLNDFIIGC